MRVMVRIFFVLLALGVAILEPGAMKRAAGEVVTFSAIVSAGAISALIFSGTMLGSKAKERILEAVEIKFWGENQNFWFLMFLSAVLCSVFVIVGQLIDWRLIISFALWSRDFQISVGAVVAFLSITFLGLTVSLMLDFSQAVRDILKISVESSNSQVAPSRVTITDEQIDDPVLVEGSSS